jgi:hypothetical protein
MKKFILILLPCFLFGSMFGAAVEAEPARLELRSKIEEIGKIHEALSKELEGIKVGFQAAVQREVEKRVAYMLQALGSYLDHLESRKSESDEVRRADSALFFVAVEQANNQLDKRRKGGRFSSTRDKDMPTSS